jgi:hypothetical protein
VILRQRSNPVHVRSIDTSSIATPARLLAQLDAQAGDVGARVDVIVCYNDDEVDTRARASLAAPPHDSVEAGSGTRLRVLRAENPCRHPLERRSRRLRRQRCDSRARMARRASRVFRRSRRRSCVRVDVHRSGKPVRKGVCAVLFFPLRQVRREISRVPLFYANNVAFRRRTFERFPFPHIVDTSRGSCLLLAERLRTAGIAIWRNSAARASHPPLSGLAHFVTRAVAQGAIDICASARGHADGSMPPPAVPSGSLGTWPARRATLLPVIERPAWPCGSCP